MRCLPKSRTEKSAWSPQSSGGLWRRLKLPRPSSCTRRSVMRILGSLIVLFGTSLEAQSAAPQAAIVGASYSVAFPLPVAPGQLITLFVAGLATPVNVPVHAPAGSLPTSLAGISAVFRQGKDLAAPVLDVFPFPTCSPLANPCGTLL